MLCADNSTIFWADEYIILRLFCVWDETAVMLQVDRDTYVCKGEKWVVVVVMVDG